MASMEYGIAPHFHGKIEDYGTLQDGALSGIVSKCGAHGGISVTHTEV